MCYVGSHLRFIFKIIMWTSMCVEVAQNLRLDFWWKVEILFLIEKKRLQFFVANLQVNIL